MQTKSIERYSLGTLADGGVVLSFVVPSSGEVYAIAFDEPGLSDFMERLEHTQEIARRRRLAVN